MTESATADYVRSQGREAMHRLIRGDRFRSHRILRDLSAMRIPFASLEAAADGMAAHAPIALENVSAAFRQIVQSARTDVGMVVITTAFYGRTAGRNPRLAVGEVDFLVTSGQRWWISEAAARRAMIPVLEHHEVYAWCVLSRWVSRDCPWIRRCVASTIRHAFRRGIATRNARSITVLTLVLETLGGEEHPTVRAAVIDALRSICEYEAPLGYRIVKRWLERGRTWLSPDAWSSLDGPRRQRIEQLSRATAGADAEA